jgi:DNA-binding HxlR family transcriptional regulator
MKQQGEAVGPCLRPLESVVRLLSHQWTIPLILLSGRSESSLRYSDIRNGLVKQLHNGISDSTLSRTLSELTDLGILNRKSFDEVPPRVEYDLTDAGQGLFQILNELGEWTREQCHLGGLRIPNRYNPVSD